MAAGYVDTADNGHVISFVGAGGKTTLMYSLAAHLTENRVKVVVTTTTHIYRPGEDLWAKKTKMYKGDGNTVPMQ